MKGRSHDLAGSEADTMLGKRVVGGRTIVIVAFVGTVLAVLFALATRGRLVANLPLEHPRPAAAAPAIPTSYGSAIWPAHSLRAAGFTLRDQNGRLFSLAAQRGTVVLVTFMDSRCTTLCPLEGAYLRQARAQAPKGLPLELVVVSTDPSGDTPASVKAFAARYGWTGTWSWSWLLGTQAQLAPVWRAYGVGVDSASAHTSVAVLVSRNGYQRAAFGVPFSRWELAADLRLLG